MGFKKLLSETGHSLFAHWFTAICLSAGTLLVPYWGMISANWSWPATATCAFLMFVASVFIWDRIVARYKHAETPALSPATNRHGSVLDATQGASQAPMSAAQEPTVNDINLLKNPTIRLDNDRRILFDATATKSADRVAIHLDVWSAGHSGPGVGQQQVMCGNLQSARDRIEIGVVDLILGKRMTMTLATISEYQGRQHVIQWGDERYGHEKAGISWNSYLGKIIVSESSNESYSFLIINAGMRVKDKSIPMIIVTPDLLAAISTHE